MTQKLIELFPEMETDAWQQDRKECWQLALDKGGWKSDYRKKDLEKIRHYFFTGESQAGLPIVNYSGLMLDLFPIQTELGYEYYYNCHEFTQDQIASNIWSAFTNQASNGMRWKEQKAYFDYHVGQTFQPEITLVTAGKKVVVSIDPVVIFKNLLSDFSTFLRKGIGGYPEKILGYVEYFKSVLDYMEKNGVEVSALESKVLPRLIERVKNENIGSRNEEVVPYQKQLIQALKPVMQKLEQRL